MLLLSAQCPALVGSWINAWVSLQPILPATSSSIVLYGGVTLPFGFGAFLHLPPRLFVCVCLSVFVFMFCVSSIFCFSLFLFSFSLLSSVFFDCHYFYFLLKKDILPITHSRTSPDVVISTYHKQRKCLLYRRPACFSSVYKMWL